MKPVKRQQRRRLSSSTRHFRGIITRSRGENFFHRSRSGRARSYSVHRRSISSFGSIKLSESSEESCVDVLHVSEDISISSIKDLRARRIFSPASVPAENFEDVKENIGGNPPVGDPQLRRVGELDLEGVFFGDSGGNADQERIEDMHRDTGDFSEVVDKKPVNIGSDGTTIE